MIPTEKLPIENFNLDDVQASLGCERKDLVDTVKKLVELGQGQFIIGRRGGKSRFIWKGKEPSLETVEAVVNENKAVSKPFTLQLNDSAPTNTEEKKEEEIAPAIKSSKPRDPFLVVRDLRENLGEEKKESNNAEVNEILQLFARITAYKGSPTTDALKAHINKLIEELYKLRESVVVEEPPEIIHVDRKLLVDNGPTFWNYEQRLAITKELLTYRRDK